jgi:hypothetical protein
LRGIRNPAEGRNGSTPWAAPKAHYGAEPAVPRDENRKSRRESAIPAFRGPLAGKSQKVLLQKRVFVEELEQA